MCPAASRHVPHAVRAISCSPGVLRFAAGAPLRRVARRRHARAGGMDARPRAAAAADDCPAGHVSVGIEELRSAMWRSLKCFGHTDADAATLMDVRATSTRAALRVEQISPCFGHTRAASSASCCTFSLSAAPGTSTACARRPQVILYAQLRDNSQGVIKIPTGAAGRDPAASSVVVERDTKLSGAPR